MASPGLDGGQVDAWFDVVVVGGGPAGCAAAVTLAHDDRSVLLVDDGMADPAFRIGEGAPPGLDRIVEDTFGPGAFVPDDHLASYANRAAWGSAEVVDTDFQFNPFGAGWHLDRVAFDGRLLDTVEAAGVVVRRGSVRAEAERMEDRWTLTMDTEAGARSVSAAIVCDTSGRRAGFARRHGGRLVVHDRLTAVVGVCRRPADPDTTTTVEATAPGWWYTAAIPGGRRVVAFFTDGDLLAPELRTTTGFIDQLGRTELVRRAVAGVEADGWGHLRVVAAGTAQLERPVGPGWLAAGDAAACFDPLSSQGVLTALLMGRTAGHAAISLLVDAGAGTDAYEERYRAVIARFHTDHRETYGLERRWPTSPFWARRHASS